MWKNANTGTVKKRRMSEGVVLSAKHQSGAGNEFRMDYDCDSWWNDSYKRFYISFTVYFQLEQTIFEKIFEFNIPESISKYIMFTT